MGGLFSKLLRIFGFPVASSKEQKEKQGTGWRDASRAKGIGPAGGDDLDRDSEFDRLLLESCRGTKSTRDIPSEVILHIHSESEKGRRAKAIAEDIKPSFPAMDATQLTRTVGTIISKGQTVSTMMTAQGDLGLDWYVWRTSRDARTRPSHRLMDRVLVSWSDPPSPELLNKEESVGCYHAGDGDGCRCYPEDLLDLSQVKWPSRVFYKGKIVKMTKPQFKKMLPPDTEIRF